jgi:hypothetical protein
MAKCQSILDGTASECEGRKMYDGFPLDDEVNVRIAEESITPGKLISVLSTAANVNE